MTRTFTAATLVIVLLPASASPAGNLLAPKGQKALLEYTVEVEGRASGSDSNAQRQAWSTRRTLSASAILTALPPSAQDPGTPGGQHRAWKPSDAMAAYTDLLRDCGKDIDCRMRVAERMQDDPRVTGDRKKGVESRKGVARYQVWSVQRSADVKGTVRVETKTDDHRRSAVDEITTCTETGEAAFEQLLSGSTWPATIKIDAETGTFAANIDVPSKGLPVKTDCVQEMGRQRNERHENRFAKFLPEGYQQASLDDVEVFRGGADGASGGRRLAHGERVVTGNYGTLMGNALKTATITVRWSITLRD